jgi:hypothetical protein
MELIKRENSEGIIVNLFTCVSDLILMAGLDVYRIQYL